MWVSSGCRGTFLCGPVWADDHAVCEPFHTVRRGHHVFVYRTSAGSTNDSRLNCSCVSRGEWPNEGSMIGDGFTRAWCVKRFSRTPPFWDEYRLGDMFQHFSQRYNAQAGVLRKYPTSIAEEYMRRTPNGPAGAMRTAVLWNVSFPGLSRGDVLTLQRRIGCVMHVRTGDVIDNNPLPVETMLQKQTVYEGGQFVNRAACFRNVIPRLHAHGCRSLTIVGNRHLSRNSSKSCEYLATVVRLFRDEAPSISLHLRLGYLPDQDVRFMALSRVFVKSRGAFSGAIAVLVRHANGTVLAMKKVGYAGKSLVKTREDYIPC